MYWNMGVQTAPKKSKVIFGKVIVYLIKHKPDLWKELEAKYDPDAKYKKKYATILQEKLNNNN
jgi:hypothetical protein